MGFNTPFARRAETLLRGLSEIHLTESGEASTAIFQNDARPLEMFQTLHVFLDIQALIAAATLPQCYRPGDTDIAASLLEGAVAQ